ncbi:MAG: DUF4301 family protein, partial [Pseudomonadota bacterium]
DRENGSRVVSEWGDHDLALSECFHADAQAWLGAEHVRRFGPYLHCVMKLIDTHPDQDRGGLSVQLHPPSDYPDRPAKPEMWLGTGQAYLGWRRRLTKSDIRAMCRPDKDAHSRSIEGALNSIELTEELPILVPGGAVHAIRANSFLAEWSLAPAEQSLELASIALFDGTDGKTPRPGKADLGAAFEVLDYCDAYNATTRFRSPAVPIDTDAAGNRREYLFREPHVCVERWDIVSTLRTPTGRGLPLFVQSGSLMVAGKGGELTLGPGEECFIPASAGECELRTLSTQPARVYIWYRPIDPPSGALIANDPEEGCVTIFTKEDREQLKVRGSELDDVMAQVATFRRGPNCAGLSRACTVGDGIRRLTPDEQQHYTDKFATGDHGAVVKFVPASGAATRMFKELSSYRASLADDSKATPDAFTVDFIEKLHRYPFHKELVACLERDGHSPRELLDDAKWGPILESLLGEQGLNYAALPKGLVRFHPYPDGNRTPFEEHLAEALHYASDAKGVARVHFTVSDQHMAAVKEHIDTVRGKYELDGAKLEVSYSVQQPWTDTVGVDQYNEPIREPSGQLHFRPGGHGALIHNMAMLDADIAFVKNIDNVVPDALKPTANRFKPILGGVLCELREKLFAFLNRLDEVDVTDDELQQMLFFAEDDLYAQVPVAVKTGSREEKVDYLQSRFDRPLRVCGMVPNSGEPGGGPFWLDGEAFALQIVESAQVEMNDSEQAERWQGSTHFNPVDVVCSLTDRHGARYELAKFVDPDSGFISHKSLYGQELKALELPGLWNGSMAYWNTVFVEVPSESFNPVKTVADLLRDAHTAT